MNLNYVLTFSGELNFSEANICEREHFANVLALLYKSKFYREEEK